MSEPKAAGYEVAEGDLASGSVLGSPGLQIRIKPGGAIEAVFCVAAGKSLLRNFIVKHWDGASGEQLEPSSGTFTLFPEHQQHRYELANCVRAVETVFVSAEPDAVHFSLELTNEGEEPRNIHTYAFCQLAADVDDSLRVRYDNGLLALVIHSKDEPKLARAIGANVRPASYGVSLDHGLTASARCPGQLSGTLETPAGPALGILHYTTTLEPRASAKIEFLLCASAVGEGPLLSAYRESAGALTALNRTKDRYWERLSHSVVLTPDTELNRGVLWAKANMERVVVNGPQGWGFTNDPLHSSNCVARDAAWFCAGSDYFNQAFSRSCLTQFTRRRRSSGLIVEYFNLIDGSTEDFGLNVNDDTPLIIWSAHHHYQLTADDEFLNAAYPSLLLACRYLAAQRNSMGLVWCTSHETGARGIAGWRNIIDGYRLSGAVTEINSECYAAFVAMAALARARNDDAAAREFDDLAVELRSAIERHLHNPENGLYYLTIDVHGTPWSDVTADLIFPVMFAVSDQEKAERVIGRLREDDFWTPGGIRTVPRGSISYTPDGAKGCMGGVWNGTTFWFAHAAAPYAPDAAADALLRAFKNYVRDPRRNDTVPGEFSEWLHGETLVNKGMDLSPWAPPRFLWATIEGVLGFQPRGDRPRIVPQLPSSWMWCAVRNLPYRNRPLTWFAARAPELRVWASRPVECDVPVEVLSEDLGDRVSCNAERAFAVALRDESRVVALVGNTDEHAIATTLRISGLDADYDLCRYDSRTGVRSEMGRARSATLREGIAVELEPKGVALIELRVRA